MNLEAVFSGLYERYRSRYVVGQMVGVYVMVALVGVLGGAIAARYVGQSLGRMLLSTAALELSLALPLAWTTWALRADFGVLRRWASGPRHPNDVTRAETAAVVLRFPRRFAIGALARVLLFTPATAAFVFGSYHGHYSTIGPFVILGSIFIIAYGGMLGYFAGELLWRPVRREAGVSMDRSEFAAVDFVSIRLKLLGGLIGLLLVSSFIVASLMAPSRSLVSGVTRAMAISFLLVPTLGLLVAVPLMRSIVEPVRDLIAGTNRVASGDLNVEAAVTSADEMGELAVSFNAMVGGLRQREALQSAMGAYVDPVIAERVLTEGHRLSGEAADVTIMFVDIVGFTTLAEDAIPEEIVSDLNDFFDLIVPVIERHGGHANKLLGDGLLAVFGVPVPLPDHADHALAAAEEIGQRLAEHYEGQLRAGIGLNSGTVVVGSMGGGRKLDYTVIGDPVNVAARVEALTRQTGDSILLTEATRQALSDPSTQLDERGTTPVKGRKQEIALYALPNQRPNNPTQSIGTRSLSRGVSDRRDARRGEVSEGRNRLA